MNHKVGIVVPTLGSRTTFLMECLNSIRTAGKAYVIVVAPDLQRTRELIPQGLVDKFIEDPKLGLAQAINLGLRSMPPEVEYCNWLGDDDVLFPGSLDKTSRALNGNPSASFAYGACDYINHEGRKIWANRSGGWASKILQFGPDLIPQPGALFRRQAFEKVGGLSLNFGFAFDFDLFIKLKKLGDAIYVPETLASFRWHPESLTVGLRKASVLEASDVRKSHLPSWLRPVSFVWEWPIRQVTLISGMRVSKLAQAGK